MNDESRHTALTTPRTTAPVDAQGRQVSEHLREAARRLSMESGTRRGIYRALGLRPRRRDLAFRVMYVLACLLFFALPLGAGLSYFTFVVSPQYEAETRFVLRSALPALPNDQTPSDANVASLKIVQDTLVVVNFLGSPSLVHRLDEEVSLDSVYGQPEIDGWWRLKPDQGQEDKAAYFEDFIDADVSSVSGIVTVKVRAFTPEEARDVLEAVFGLAEERVNQLNGEIWSSVLEVAERNFDTASDQLRDTRARYAALQNETGVFDVELEAEALSDVIKALRTELIDLENRRATLLLEVPETHINIKRFDQAISVRTEQLERLEAELASAQTGDAASLSNNQKRFDALEVEVEVAQDRFKAAATELEQARLLNSVQMLYLDRFMRPALPEDSVYPVYSLEIAKLLILCLAAWGIAALALNMLQRRLD
ncbi:MAG: hypothetical protein AAF231_01100 [Pseudomonadota bacterium]